MSEREMQQIKTPNTLLYCYGPLTHKKPKIKMTILLKIVVVKKTCKNSQISLGETERPRGELA